MNFFPKRRILAAALLVACGSGGALAADLDDAAAKHLFNAKGCNACHATGEMRIGPPYVAVAARYASEPRDERIGKLAAKIRFGGAGAWGSVPMVSNPNVSPEEADAIARWIMSLPPTAK